MVTFFTVMVVASVILSPRGDALRLRIASAMAAARISNKAAAITMRLTQQRLSEAIARGQSPLSVFRLAELSDEFWEHFDAAGVQSRGGVVLTDPKIARLIDAVDHLAMAKAGLPTRTVTLPLGQAVTR